MGLQIYIPMSTAVEEVLTWASAVQSACPKIMRSATGMLYCEMPQPDMSRR
jgi:hypothetical protein